MWRELREGTAPCGFSSPSDLQVVERKQRVQAQQQRLDASKEHLEQMRTSLSAVKAGVEHLAGRLHHIRLVNPPLSI